MQTVHTRGLRALESIGGATTTAAREKLFQEIASTIDDVQRVADELEDALDEATDASAGERAFIIVKLSYSSLGDSKRLQDNLRTNGMFAKHEIIARLEIVSGPVGEWCAAHGVATALQQTVQVDRDSCARGCFDWCRSAQILCISKHMSDVFI